MNSQGKRAVQVLLIVLGILIVGTVGYYLIEGNWGLFDAFYMTAITITTVGFGEIRELTPKGRIFTVVLIFLGIGVVALSASQLAGFIVERELREVLGRKKMHKQLRSIRGHYVICGFGRIGRAICYKLQEESIPFVVVETDERACHQAEQRGYMAVKGDATNDATLVAAGIERSVGIVACISSDAANLFIALAARELNSGIHIIARGDDPSVEDRMLRAGADTVVYPLKLGGEQIAALVAQTLGKTVEAGAAAGVPGVLGYYLRVFRHYDSKAVTVADVLQKTGALSAVALKPEGGDPVDRPGLEVEVSKNDSLVLLVNEAYSSIAKPKQGASAFLKWSQEMSVGIVSFDQEHKHILDLINKLEQAVSSGHGKEVLSSVFDNLIDYTATHFENEEEYFKKHAYPEMDVHIREHEDLTKRVLDLNREKNYVFPDNVSEFLRTWIKDHILGTDKRYGRYLSDKGVR